MAAAGRSFRRPRGRLLGGWLAFTIGTNLFAAQVHPGIDTLAASGFPGLRGKRVGLISNPTGINRRGEPTWRVLRSAPGVTLVALFGAEHGFDGRAKAGQEVADARHRETGLPIHSLYGPGPTRRPTPRMLQGLDVLVYDLQDTGCRSYTYISTLGLAMEACAEAGVAFMVLDRPNPLGGIRVEGPGVAPPFKSFVSQWPIPYVYGLTPGELARMINGEGWIDKRVALTVIPMLGWTRRSTWNDTGLTWVASSPNVPRGDTPLYLVATGMLGEIGGLNLGTGTAHSFRLIGASWLSPDRFTTQMNAYRLPGVKFEPLAMDFNRDQADGHELKGTRLRFTDPATAPLAAINFYALEAVRKTSGRDLFQLAVKRGKRWDMFDKVSGSDALRKALQAGRPAREIVASWRPFEEAFRQKRAPYLLYPDQPPRSAPAPPPAGSRAPTSAR